MAFTLPYKFGVSNKDLEISDGAYEKLNSYAKVTKIEQDTVTIDLDNLIEGEGGKFQAGEIAMIHCSATNRPTADFLGKYLIAKITLISSDGVLTFDKNIEEFFSGVNLDYEYLQVIVIAQFHCLKLNEGALLTCPPYNPYTFTNGILAVMCSDTFEFNGGHVLLEDCGIPANRKNALRPLTMQETPANGLTDKAKLSGQENFITAERFLLNAGDGAFFLITKNLKCNENSRIGNINTHGAAFCRGATDSVGVKPSNIINVGGTSILLAAENIENFIPKILAKYRNADKPEGRGLCRCYIASNTKLRTDEGLYATSYISDFNRVRELGIENFGNGTFGDCVNPAAPLNNYAAVAEISQGGYKLRMTGNTLNGMTLFNTDALIMVLAIKKSSKYTDDAGKFVIGRIIKREGNYITINKKIPFDTGKYFVQAVTIPEFNNLTINQNYTCTPKFDGRKGGVFAVAVAKNFNLSNGKLLIEGGAVAYGKSGLEHIGLNGQMADRLPIGEGAGSAFILAKNLIMNENSRICSAWSGLGEGGRLGGNNTNGSNLGGGYCGNEDENQTGSGGGFIGGGGAKGLGGSGASGGTSTLGEFDATKIVGGYGGANGQGKTAGKAGGHIMIVADTITGFTQAAISTGGQGAKGAQNGAASFGGGGNSDSGGGAGGGCYIFCNNSL